MGKFNNKKVLQIGNGALTIQNIKYLKENGAYIVVADICPKEKNIYKDLVDEVVQLDINNIDKVIDFAKINNINAVLSNGAEETYETIRIINESIGNAFCHTKEQWNTFVNKGKFVELCKRHRIDIPKTYYFGDYKNISSDIKSSISFPIIVKPVDNAGGIGISVVFNKRNLEKAIKYAGRCSNSDTIIIEEYIVGKEVVFTYVVQNGVYKLTASADKYVYKDKRNLTVIPDLYIYPCNSHDLYAEKVNEKVIGMLKEQGLNNCSIFFQTIEKDNKFYFFEAGLRFEGTKTYLITSYLTGQNACNFYYDYLLKTTTDYNIEKDDPKLNGHKLAMFAIHLKEGKIKSITGANLIRNNEKITQRYYLNKEGGKVGKLPLNKCFAAFCMDASNTKDLIEQIKFIKKALKVKDYFNRNMIVDSFDENILLLNKGDKNESI